MLFNITGCLVFKINKDNVKLLNVMFISKHQKC